MFILVECEKNSMKFKYLQQLIVNCSFQALLICSENPQVSKSINARMYWCYNAVADIGV